MDLRWKHPFTAMIAGPTSSGKSCFTVRLLEGEENTCDVKFDSIIWCYSITHPNLRQNLNNVQYIQGLPNIEELQGNVGATLLVLDDMMRQCNESILDLFTKGSHHLGISVIFITQNLYHKGKHNRDISLNCHYLVLFKNPRDYTQAKCLARQVCKTSSKQFIDAYEDATKRPFGYLLIDFKQSTPDDCRFRTNIFSEAAPGFPIVYAPYKYATTKHNMAQ